MLKNAYFLAKIDADTAENEQRFAEICRILWSNLVRYWVHLTICWFNCAWAGCGCWTCFVLLPYGASHISLQRAVNATGFEYWMSQTAHRVLLFTIRCSESSDLQISSGEFRTRPPQPWKCSDIAHDFGTQRLGTQVPSPALRVVAPSISLGRKRPLTILGTQAPSLAYREATFVLRLKDASALSRY